MLWTLDRKLIEEDFSDKLRPVLMATLRELNCRRVLFNDSTPSVGMSYYKRTGNQDGGSCDGSELQRVILRLVGNGKTKAAYFGWNGRPFFVLLCDVETAAFNYAFALGSFYVDCLVACIIVRSFPLCGIILL